jgi:hypothetical protein
MIQTGKIDEIDALLFEVLGDGYKFEALMEE